MNRPKASGANVGGAMILVIFVVLCLAIFGTLSAVSAHAEKRLTDKAAAAVTSYYEADSAAEKTLAVIDGKLADAQALGITGESYLSACAQALQSVEGLTVSRQGDRLALSYRVIMENDQHLDVTLAVPASPTDGERYVVTTWKVVRDNVPEYSETEVDLWDPGTIIE